MTSRRFESEPRAIARLQRKVAELSRRASRIGHTHGSITVRALRTANQTFSSGSVFRIEFETEVFSHDPAGDVSWVTDRFVINRAGVYEAHVNAQIEGSSSGNRRLMGVQHQGLWRGRNEVQNMSGSGIQLSASGYFEAEVGDVVTAVFYQDSGGDLDLVSGADDETRMTIRRLR